MAAQDKKLALLGGQPVTTKPLNIPAWPPVSEAVAKRLSKVYLSRKWSFNGPEELAFAQEFADFHGAKYGIFMVNGTVTLQCALAVHGIGRGDEVIVPALTWIATAMAPRYLGAKPVFVDIEPSTLCMDPKAFEAAITRRTRAVIPVHLYGGMADLDAIRRIAKKHGLVVIEDCAHMQGGKWKHRGVGSWGHVGSFSLQQSKTLSSGEGGMCITNDAGVAERLHRIKHIGYGPNTTQGGAKVGPPPGLECYNFRGTDFQAVILRDQLRKLGRLIGKYNRNADRLERHLEGLPGLHVQARGRKASPQGYYAWCVCFDDGPLARVPLTRIHEALRAEGVGVFGGTYGPVYRHMLWNLRPSQYRIACGTCPVADDLATNRTLVMAHPVLGADARSINAIGKALAKVIVNGEALLESRA